MSKILKIKEWLKFKNPDYEGLVEHLKIWNKERIPYTTNDLQILAKNYGTPVPYLDSRGDLIIDVDIKHLLTKE